MLSKLNIEKELIEVLTKKLKKNKKLQQEFVDFTKNHKQIMFRFEETTKFLYVTNLEVKDILILKDVVDKKTLKNYFVD